MAERVNVFARAISNVETRVAVTDQALAIAITRENLWYQYSKRALDVILSAALLLLLLPLLIITAIAICLDSLGPAVFIQRRVGKGGRLFDFYKFRSMYRDTDPDLHQEFARQYINGNGHQLADASYTESPIFKPADDKRVTRIGRILRKTSLDELPQLVNVLKGDMSLVGPRPSIVYELKEYAPWHLRRLDVLPGLTGWAQIHGRSTLLFDTIVVLDIKYIEHRSLWMDLWILLRTIPVVLSCQGAR